MSKSFIGVVAIKTSSAYERREKTPFLRVMDSVARIPIE